MIAMPVPVVPVVKKPVAVYTNTRRRTEAIRGISLQPRISGYIQSQDTADGADVHRGRPALHIDPRDVQAALDQAKAQASATATLEYARSNLNRGAALVRNGFLAKDAYDQRVSASGQPKRCSAWTTLRCAPPNSILSYTQIRAPFPAGLAVIRLRRHPRQSRRRALNTLVQLSPIYVTFNPSETELRKSSKQGLLVQVDADILVPGTTSRTPAGELTFLDNSVDRSTGTIIARATIANLDRSVLPGQYVHVRISLHEIPDALMVPQAAIGSGQLGKYVYVVSPESKVEQRLYRSVRPTATA